MQVYKAINEVQARLAEIGITKAQKNMQQGYKFRGIDDVYNAVSPILAEKKLCILPRMLSRIVTERETSKGGTLFYVTVDAEFDFISANDGSKHTVKMYGEAMDSGDKATNKAMSAAYKYACIQTFAIPTEGDNDADSFTHEVKAKNTEVNNEKTPPAITKLISLCKENKIDLKEFTKLHNISSSNIDSVRKAVDNFDNLKEIFHSMDLDMAPLQL